MDFLLRPDIDSPFRNGPVLVRWCRVPGLADCTSLESTLEELLCLLFFCLSETEPAAEKNDQRWIGACYSIYDWRWRNGIMCVLTCYYATHLNQCLDVEHVATRGYSLTFKAKIVIC